MCENGFEFYKSQQINYFNYVISNLSVCAQVELTGSSVFDYVHPGDQVEMAEQLGMKLPPGRSLLSQGAGAEDGASSASSSSHSETPEPGKRGKLSEISCPVCLYWPSM